MNKEEQELQDLKDIEEDIQEEQREDMTEDSQDTQTEFQEGYGDFPQEEKHNAHTFLNKAAFVAPDTLRVTDLDKEELGKPIFPVRFLLDMEDISDFYLSELCKEYEMPNKIAEYFRNKIINITDSGMSKEGFTMKMNTTRNVNIARTKTRRTELPMKGGNRR